MNDTGVPHKTHIFYPKRTEFPVFFLWKNIAGIYFHVSHEELQDVTFMFSIEAG